MSCETSGFVLEYKRFDGEIFRKCCLFARVNNTPQRADHVKMC